MGDYAILISDLDSTLLRRWLAGDDSVVRELVEGFWDRQYERKFGLPRIPGIRWPIGPQPDPSPLLDLLQNEISANVLGYLLGDPDPEPNRRPEIRGRNLVKLLNNKVLRLASAKAIRERTMVALKLLDEEIADLSRRGASAAPQQD